MTDGPGLRGTDAGPKGLSGPGSFGLNFEQIMQTGPGVRDPEADAGTKRLSGPRHFGN